MSVRRPLTCAALSVLAAVSVTASTAVDAAPREEAAVTVAPAPPKIDPATLFAHSDLIGATHQVSEEFFGFWAHRTDHPVTARVLPFTDTNMAPCGADGDISSIIYFSDSGVWSCPSTRFVAAYLPNVAKGGVWTKGGQPGYWAMIAQHLGHFARTELRSDRKGASAEKSRSKDSCIAGAFVGAVAGRHVWSPEDAREKPQRVYTTDPDRKAFLRGMDHGLEACLR